MSTWLLHPILSYRLLRAKQAQAAALDKTIRAIESGNAAATKLLALGMPRPVVIGDRFQATNLPEGGEICTVVALDVRPGRHRLEGQDGKQYDIDERIMKWAMRRME